MQAQKNSGKTQSCTVASNDVNATPPEQSVLRSFEACTLSDNVRFNRATPVMSAPDVQVVAHGKGARQAAENTKLSEIHTDSGTLGLLSKLVASCDSHGLDKGVAPLRVSSVTFFEMLDVLKSKAKDFEDKLVAASERHVNVFVDAYGTNRNDSNNTAQDVRPNPNALAARVNRLLNNARVRRGPAVSQQALARRTNLLIDRAAAGQPLRYAVLLLPFRGKCEFKHVGTLPDLGETISLLRLWAIGSAISRLVENKRATLDAILAEMGKESLDQIVRFDDAGENLDAFCNAFLLQTTGAHKKMTWANTLDYRGTGMSIVDKAACIEFATKMRKRDLALSDLLMLRANPIGNTYILGLRDSERYTSFEATPSVIKQDYGDALRFLMEKLDLPNSVQLRMLPKAISGAAASNRRFAYEEIYDALMKKIISKRTDLGLAKSRTAFNEVLANVDPYDDRFQYIAKIYESVLLSLHSESTNAYFAEQNYDYGDKAVFYASLYERSDLDSRLDGVKKALLWQGIVGAVKYVASYYANSKEYNRFAFDDVEQLAPEAIRATIHRKSESKGQPCLSLGPNPHRTPWHGTAAIVKNPKANRYTHATLLDIECKSRRLRPVLIAPPTNVATGSGKAAERNTMTLMAEMRYPLCYVHSDDESDLATELDVKSIFTNAKFF